MRTCFVPFCDSKNKDQPNRTMFLVPKQQKLFTQWAEILPKVRTLRLTDRVCYLHFKPNDIISTFDHCINGQIFKIQRDRPKLKPNALPCLEMTSEQELLSYRVKNRLTNNSKILKNTDIIETDSIYELITEDPDEKPNELQVNTKINEEIAETSENCTIVINFEEESNEIQNTLEEQETNNELETQIIDLDMGELSYECKEPEELTQNNINTNIINTEVRDLFDLIYDKVFEVLIPNSLWGIHRCPNRSLVCFTYMDISKLQVTKILTIFEDASVQLIFNGTLIKTLQLLQDIMDLHSLAVVLSEMDNWSLSSDIETNAECTVFAEPNDDICWITEDN